MFLGYFNYNEYDSYSDGYQKNNYPFNFKLTKKKIKPTKEELQQHLYFREEKIINKLKTQYSNEILIVLGYQAKEDFYSKLNCLDSKIPQNKLHLFLDFDYGDELHTIAMNIYVFSDNLFPILEEIDIGDIFEKTVDIKIILHNSMVITEKLIEKIQNIFHSFRYSIGNDLDFRIQYQDKSNLELQYQNENQNNQYCKQKNIQLNSANLSNLYLQNDQNDITLNSIFQYFLKNSYKITLKQDSLTHYSCSSEQNKSHFQDILSEKFYQNLDKIFLFFQNYEHLQKLDLNFRKMYKLSQNHIQKLKKLLNDSQLLTSFVVEFDNLSQYPYINDSTLDDFLNFNPGNRTIQFINIEIGDQQFSLHRSIYFWSKEVKKYYYKIEFSLKNREKIQYKQLIEDFSQLSVQKKDYNNKKEQHNNKNDYNLEFQKYDPPALRPKQFQSLIKLMKNKSYPLTEIILDLKSKYLYDNSDLFTDMFNTLAEIMNTYQKETKFKLNLQFLSQHLHQYQVKTKFQDLIATIKENKVKFQANITITHSIYEISSDIFTYLNIKILASQQKKIPYLQQNIQFFSQIKLLSIESTTESATDLQMWSLFQSLEKQTDFLNLKNFKLVFDNCDQLSDEFFIDFSKFIQKKGNSIKKLKLKLSNNNQITQQSIKIFCKSFRHFINLNSINLKFSEFSHLGFENLSFLMKALAQENEKLTKFKLFTNFPGDIATLNQGLSTLIKKTTNILKKMIICLPKLNLKKKVSPTTFFPIHINFKILDLLVLSGCKSLILFQKNEKKEKNQDLLKNFIYLNLRGNYSDFYSTGWLLNAYLLSLKSSLQKIKFKLFEYLSDLQEIDDKSFKKYTSKIPITPLYYIPEIYQTKFVELLWKCIGLALEKMEDLQFLQVKDYYPNNNTQDVKISDCFQNDLIGIPEKNLKELKIKTNFFKLKYVQQEQTTQLQADQQEKRLNKLYLQESVEESVRNSMSYTYQQDFHQENKERQQYCFNGILLNLGFYLQKFQTDIDQFDLYLESSNLYNEFYTQSEQFLSFTGPQFKTILFSFPNCYIHEEEPFEPIISMNFRNPDIEFALFNDPDKQRHFQQQNPQLQTVFDNIKSIQKRKKNEKNKSLLFIQSLGKNLKFEKCFIQEIVSYSLSNLSSQSV